MLEKIVKQYELARAKKVLSPAEHGKYFQLMINNGMNIREVSKQFNLHYDKIRRWLKAAKNGK